MAEVEPAAGVSESAMQRLANILDRPSYLALQQEIAEQLGMTMGNVQHLKAWERDGVREAIRQGRSDREERRLDEEWSNYIVQTYRAGIGVDSE